MTTMKLVWLFERIVANAEQLSVFHSFIHSRDLYSASSRHYYSEALTDCSHGQRRVGYAMSMLSDLVACDSSRNARVALPEDMRLPIICTSIIPSIYILAPQLYCFIISVQSQGCFGNVKHCSGTKDATCHIPLFHYLRI